MFTLDFYQGSLNPIPISDIVPIPATKQMWDHFGLPVKYLILKLEKKISPSAQP